MERPRPDQNKEFEMMVREFISREYESAHGHFTLYGRNGQRQYGCDVKDQSGKIIVQCKCYDSHKRNIYDELYAAIRDDYEVACKQFHNMEMFVVCTTLDNSSDTTNKILALEGKFGRNVPLHVYFWDSIESSINNSYTANKQYADEFIKPLFLHKKQERMCLRNLFVPQKYSLIKDGTNYQNAAPQDDLYEKIAEFIKQNGLSIDTTEKKNNKARTNCRLMIIEADAGCGKTSLVQSLCYIDREDERRAEHLFDGRPIVTVRLRDLNKDLISYERGLMPALLEYLEVSGNHHDEQMREINRRFPNAVLILDGFDELCIIEGFSNYEYLIHKLMRERLDGWKIIIISRPQYIRGNIDIPSVFIALDHFDKDKRAEWIKKYTDPSKCGGKIDEKVSRFIIDNNAIGICDTPLSLYLIAGGDVEEYELKNQWRLYNRIFGTELTKRQYDTYEHPGERFADLSYRISEQIAHIIYSTGNEKLYINGNQLSGVVKSMCNVGQKDIKDIVEHCLGLSCYWKISEERGIAEFYHNNIRDFFLCEMIWRCLNDIYTSQDLSSEEKSNRIISLFIDMFRKAPLEARVCKFIELKSEWLKESQFSGLADYEDDACIMPVVINKLLSDGKLFNNLNEQLLLPTIGSIIQCAVQVYKAILKPYGEERRCVWWINSNSIRSALVFDSLYRRIWMNHSKDSIDFTYSDFTEVDLEEFDFHNVDMSYSDFSGADLVKTNLSYAKLNHAILLNAELKQADLSFADLREAIIDMESLKDAILIGVDFSGNNLPKFDFRELDLRKVVFAKAILKEAKFWRADLTGADFRFADLSGADLTYSNLEDADMRGAILINTKLPDGVYSADQNAQIKHLKGLHISGLTV